MANLTWLNNRAEMYAYLNNMCNKFNTAQTAKEMYDMTLNELQQVCVDYGDHSVKATLALTDTTIEA